MKYPTRDPMKIMLLVLTLAVGCSYPDRQVRPVNKEHLKERRSTNTPAKVFLSDASIVLFKAGFIIANDTLIGAGQRFFFSGDSTKRRLWQLPLDSVVAANYYHEEISGGKAFSGFLFGLFGTILTPLSVYCSACPKCCFGSCPTVYSYEGTAYRYETELFSYCVSKLMEGSDLDILSTKPRKDGSLTLRVTNEALETHYINSLNLFAVDHPLGTKVFPGPDGDIVVVSEPRSISRATSRTGTDITGLLQSGDGVCYRSDTSLVTAASDGIFKDWIDIHVSAPKGVPAVALIVRLRNTLLSTTLFYDVVLASQGAQALDWTRRMHTDRRYASQFNSVYRAFSGIRVNVLQTDKLYQLGSISDPGPIGWKSVAVRTPVGHLEKLTFRLEFFPDNFLIDYVGLAVPLSSDSSVVLRSLDLAGVQDNLGDVRDDVGELIARDDDQYLVTNPGEAYRLDYRVHRNENHEITIATRSRGFYTEWVRGGWMKLDRDAYRFNLDDIRGTICRLAETWRKEKELIETEFFRSRVPIREGS